MFSSIVLIVCSAIYLLYRYRLAIRGQCVEGFVLNPLFSVVFFSIFYMLVGNLFAAIPEAYYFFNLQMYWLTTKESVVIVNSFYSIIFIFYFFSKDNKLEKLSYIPLSTSYKNLIFFFGIILFIYFSLMLLISWNEIYPLRGVSRVDAFSAYIASVWQPYRYGVFINFACLYFFLSGLFSNNRVNYLLVALIFLFIVLIDYTHGGRSITMKVSLLLYLMYVLKVGKLRVLAILAFLIVLALVGLLQRGSDLASLASLYVFFGEFVLTRATTDVVLTLQLSGDPTNPFLCFFFSLFPGLVAGYLGIENCFLGGLIKDEAGFSFGLASNLVTEALYYFGSYYAISAFLIGLYFFFLNKYAFRFGLVGLLIIFLTIVSIQDIMRTSFYDFGLVLFYLIFSYFLVFTLVFYRKKILKKAV